MINTQNMNDVWAQLLNSEGEQKLLEKFANVACIREYTPIHSADYFQLIAVNNVGRAYITAPLPHDLNVVSAIMYLNDAVTPISEEMRKRSEALHNTYLSDRYEIRQEGFTGKELDMLPDFIEITRKALELDEEDFDFVMATKVQAGVAVYSFMKGYEVVHVEAVDYIFTMNNVLNGNIPAAFTGVDE